MEVKSHPTYEQNFETFLFWGFKDFCHYVNHGDPNIALQSPELQCKKTKSNWILQVCRNHDHISVSIVGLTVTEPLHCNIAVSCLNSIYQETTTQRRICMITPDRPVCLFSNFVETSFLLQRGCTGKMLPNGELLIQCIIIYLPMPTPKVAPKRETKLEINGYISVNKFRVCELEDFGKLMNDFGNEFYSDAKLVIDGCNTEINVHRCILAVRSRVFAEMFKQETEMMKIFGSADGAPAMVRVYDIDEPTLRALLLFIYTGKVDCKQNNEMAVKLLKAADSYELVALKKICEDVLIRNLNVNNVSLCLAIAETCKAKRLHDAAMAFHRRNARAVNQEIKVPQKTNNYSGATVVTGAPNGLISDGVNFWNCY